MELYARGATVTATATLTTGTAASLVTGDADYFLDIIEVTMSSNTTVTTNVAFVNDGTTVRTFQVAAGATNQFIFEPALRQLTKNTPWNVDMEDVTASTVSIGATLIRVTENQIYG